MVEGVLMCQCQTDTCVTLIHVFSQHISGTFFELPIIGSPNQAASYSTKWVLSTKNYLDHRERAALDIGEVTVVEDKLASHPSATSTATYM